MSPARIGKALREFEFGAEHHTLAVAVDRGLEPGGAIVGRELSSDGVLAGHAGGDSGLFGGILARYLASVALGLPNEAATADTAPAAAITARTLVLRSAEAAWANAALVDGLPLFGPDWSRPARVPTTRGAAPERDLSVQLSGWMLMEAACRIG